MEWKNKLYFGDNLGIPRQQIESASIDLIYLDPPFNSSASGDLPGRYPRLQILTIAELLDGKKISFPEHRVETFAKAARKSKAAQEELF